jgi:transposase
LGYLWTCAEPRGETVFHWETSRAARCLENIIPINFSGTLQCDGYEAYPCFAKAHGQPLVLASCLAHVRRKFFDAREQAPKVASFILKQIAHLYELEARLRETRAGPNLRQARRASLSQMIMERLRRVLERLKQSHRFLPRSLMGQAIHYALEQWNGLLVFLADGHVEIDNNLVENAIRPTAVGKRNWLFIGEAEAGQRSAILYTIIESCRRHGLDPFAYLREAFGRLPTMTIGQVKDITPAACAQAAKRTGLSAAA